VAQAEALAVEGRRGGVGRRPPTDRRRTGADRTQLVSLPSPPLFRPQTLISGHYITWRGGTIRPVTTSYPRLPQSAPPSLWLRRRARAGRARPRMAGRAAMPVQPVWRVSATALQ